MAKLLWMFPALAAALICSAVSAAAAQLRVEPVLLEMNAPAAAGTLTLRNDENREVTVQTRVLRWSQSDGKETLEPTTDVVASPPSVSLKPGADYVVRVVRVTKRPVQGEEAYRVIVDQLPQLGRSQNRTVNLLIRQSIPVFFRARELTQPSLTWSVALEGGRVVVTGRNAGDERVKITALQLKDKAGASVSFGRGLIGYVLGRSSMSWNVQNRPRGFGASGSISVTAETDKGPSHAVVDTPLRR